MSGAKTSASAEAQRLLMAVLEDENDSESQFKLAVAYLEGWLGLEQDIDQACARLRISSDLGHPKASRTLAHLIRAGTYGLPRNLQESFDLFQKAADMGDADAQFMVARMCHRGEGVERDDARAATYYRKAADQGHTESQYNIACFYSKGKGITKNLTAAASYCILAAQAHHKGAQFMMGVMYARGDGVSRDLSKASRMYDLAATQGHVKASNHLAEWSKHLARNLPSTTSESGSCRSLVIECVLLPGVPQWLHHIMECTSRNLASARLQNAVEFLKMVFRGDNDNVESCRMRANRLEQASRSRSMVTEPESDCDDDGDSSVISFASSTATLSSRDLLKPITTPQRRKNSGLKNFFKKAAKKTIRRMISMATVGASSSPMGTAEVIASYSYFYAYSHDRPLGDSIETPSMSQN